MGDWYLIEFPNNQDFSARIANGKLEITGIDLEAEEVASILTGRVSGETLAARTLKGEMERRGGDPEEVLRTLHRGFQRSLEVLAKHDGKASHVRSPLLLAWLVVRSSQAVAAKNCPREALIWVAAYGSEWERAWVAAHPNADETVRMVLARDKDAGVRRWTARAETISPELQHQLARDPAPKVRGRLAEREDLLPELLEKLIEDPAPLVRGCVATRQDLSAEQRERVLGDPSPQVRSRAAKAQLLTAEQQWRLAKDRAQDVRRMLLGNPQPLDPAIVELLSRDPAAWVRCATSQRPELTPEALARFADDPDEQVRRVVARNPRMPMEALMALMLDQDRWVAHGAASNPILGPAVIARLAGRAFSGHVRHGLASNPNAPAEALRKLAGVNPSAVAAHPNASEDILVHLALSCDLTTAVCIAENPNVTEAPLALLERGQHGRLIKKRIETSRRAIARRAKEAQKQDASL